MKKTYKKIEKDGARIKELNEIVDSLRNLGYSKEKIEEIKANLLADLQANQEIKVIENIVDGYRKLGYLEEEIEKIKADLFANLQKKIRSNIEKDVNCIEVECECGSTFATSEIRHSQTKYYDRFYNLYRDWKHVIDKFGLKCPEPSGLEIPYDFSIYYEYVICPECKDKVITSAELHCFRR